MAIGMTEDWRARRKMFTSIERDAGRRLGASLGEERRVGMDAAMDLNQRTPKSNDGCETLEMRMRTVWLAGRMR